MNIIRAQQLSGEHLGQTVAFPFEGQQITGQLLNITHHAQLIASEKLCDTKPVFSVGRSFVTIGFHPDGEAWPKAQLEPDTPITIQEGQ